MGLKGDEFYQQLENDLKQLAGEAKRSDTFTGQLSGLLLLSGPEHPHIREATDRSLAKLRAWKEDESGHTFVIDKVGSQQVQQGPLVMQATCPRENISSLMPLLVDSGFSQAISSSVREQKHQAHSCGPCQLTKAACQ